MRIYCLSVMLVKKNQVVVAFNPSTWETRQVDFCEFEVSLVYKASFLGQPRLHKESLSLKTKQNKTQHNKTKGQQKSVKNELLLPAEAGARGASTSVTDRKETSWINPPQTIWHSLKMKICMVFGLAVSSLKPDLQKCKHLSRHVFRKLHRNTL